MLRRWMPFLSLLSLPLMAGADAPGVLPEPETQWVVENSWVGERGRSELDLTIDGLGGGGVELPTLDVPGVDLTWGDHYFDGVPEPEPIAPESLVGVSR